MEPLGPLTSRSYVALPKNPSAFDRHAAQRRALGFYPKGQSWTNSKLLRRVTLDSKKRQSDFLQTEIKKSKQ